MMSDMEYRDHCAALVLGAILGNCKEALRESVVASYAFDYAEYMVRERRERDFPRRESDS